MIKALRSVPEYPALLAPLAGMDRMCVNATIDLDWLDAQLRRVTRGRAAGRVARPDRSEPAPAGLTETS